MRASVYTIGGFSAHADQAELLAWHAHTGNPKRTFLMHGEEESMQAFAKKLSNSQVHMPALNETYELGGQ